MRPRGQLSRPISIPDSRIRFCGAWPRRVGARESSRIQTQHPSCTLTSASSIAARFFSSLLPPRSRHSFSSHSICNHTRRNALPSSLRCAAKIIADLRKMDPSIFRPLFRQLAPGGAIASRRPYQRCNSRAPQFDQTVASMLDVFSLALPTPASKCVRNRPMFSANPSITFILRPTVAPPVDATPSVHHQRPQSQFIVAPAFPSPSRSDLLFQHKKCRRSPSTRPSFLDRVSPIPYYQHHHKNNQLKSATARYQFHPSHAHGFDQHLLLAASIQQQQRPLSCL